MIEPHRSDRGFKHFDPILGSSYAGEPTGESVCVYESSAAAGPCVWMCVIDPDVGQATAHLTLEAATTLRDQLTYLIEHHYQLTDAR